MFYYRKNQVHMKNSIAVETSAVDTIPLFWMFEAFIDPNLYWTAYAYSAIFINGFFVSLLELIAVFYYYAGEMRWLAWYANTVGWIFAVFGMLVPVTMAAL